MDEVEFNKVVDEWYEKVIVSKGKIKIPRVGAWPVDLEVGIHSLQMNEYITTDLIRHYAEAVGDRNPLWNDQAYAEKTSWKGIIAPPTITDSIAVSWPTRRGPVSDLKFELPGLPAGSKRQWFTVMRPGDKIRLVDELVELEEKKSKQKGPIRLFLETYKRSYINQNDETVADVYCHMVHIAAPKDYTPEEGSAFFSGGGRARTILTDEQREAIYKGYDSETRRGSDTLYWDEVVEGEELKPLRLGPVTTWHTASWLAALAGYAVAFEVEWEIIKADFRFAWFDEKWNIWKCGGEGHLYDGGGPTGEYSGGHAFAYGSQIEGLICRMICNWMGDDGFLKEQDCSFRNIPILGDSYHIKGSVTKKYIEGDDHLVDLKVHCENQDGLILVPGNAKVRLPHK